MTLSVLNSFKELFSGRSFFQSMSVSLFLSLGCFLTYRINSIKHCLWNFWRFWCGIYSRTTCIRGKCAKKVVSYSSGLVDFAIILTCLMGKWSFLGNWSYRRTVINPVHQNILFRPIKMTLRQVHANYTACQNGKL